MGSTNKLEVFLYLLGRDGLPLGQIEQFVQDAEKAGEQNTTFSNDYLHAYVTSIISRLLTSPRTKSSEIDVAVLQAVNRGYRDALAPGRGATTTSTCPHYQTGFSAGLTFLEEHGGSNG